MTAAFLKQILQPRCVFEECIDQQIRFTTAIALVPTSWSASCHPTLGKLSRRQRSKSRSILCSVGTWAFQCCLHRLQWQTLVQNTPYNGCLFVRKTHYFGDSSHLRVRFADFRKYFKSVTVLLLLFSGKRLLYVIRVKGRVECPSGIEGVHDLNPTIACFSPLLTASACH